MINVIDNDGDISVNDNHSPIILINASAARERRERVQRSSSVPNNISINEENNRTSIV